MKTLTIAAQTLVDLAAFADPKVSFRGSKVVVEFRQELYNAEGQFKGEATVQIEGVRNFGRTVSFTLPLQPRIVGASSPEDIAYLEEMAGFVVEAFHNIATETH